MKKYEIISPSAAFFATVTMLLRLQWQPTALVRDGRLPWQLTASMHGGKLLWQLVIKEKNQKNRWLLCKVLGCHDHR